MIVDRTRDEEYVSIKPTARQLLHQELEFYAFFHFGINTFTDKEWGDGTDKPELFHPTKMNAQNWVDAIKKAGMKGAILTCKHHDGFCLWPTKYSEYSVKNSPYKDGKGDIVKEVSDALRKEELKFGVYLSPWDRNSRLYGSGKAYDDYYVNQLQELLTEYGDVFTVWLDGACGEGPNGRKQIYDWERYYKTIRTLMPNACISVCGADVRWCGNEAGDTRESEWSVVPAALKDAERIADKSQKSDNDAFRTKKISSMDLDLGSRHRLENERNLIWYPAEVNTSIRPGWFYHASEDTKIKKLSELVDIYEKSVGGNATFLLNIPPNREGLIQQEDYNRLAELGAYIKEKYEVNLAEEAELIPDGKAVSDKEHVLKTDDGVYSASIRVLLPQKTTITRVVLMEDIKESQRIEAFRVEGKMNSRYQTLYEGTTIGYKKIASFEEVVTDELRISILDSRVSVRLKSIGVYA